MKTLVEYLIENNTVEHEYVWVVQDEDDDLSSEVSDWVDENHRDWFSSTEGDLLTYKSTVLDYKNINIDNVGVAYEFISDNRFESYKSDNWKVFVGRKELNNLIEKLIEENEEKKRWIEFEKKQMKLSL